MNILGICNSSICNDMSYHKPYMQSRSVGSVKLIVPAEQRRRPLECPDCRHALMWIKENQRTRAGSKFGGFKKNVVNKEFSV